MVKSNTYFNLRVIIVVAVLAITVAVILNLITPNTIIIIINIILFLQEGALLPPVPHSNRRLTRIERSLRVLNSVTNENQDNIKYLISFRDSSLLSTLVTTLQLGFELFRRHPLTAGAKSKETVGAVVYRLIDVTFGTLINLTNNEWGATKSSFQGKLPVLFYSRQRPVFSSPLPPP